MSDTKEEMRKEQLRKEFESATGKQRRFYWPIELKDENGEYLNPYVESAFLGFILGRQSSPEKADNDRSQHEE